MRAAEGDGERLVGIQLLLRFQNFKVVVWKRQNLLHKLANTVVLDAFDAIHVKLSILCLQYST